LINDSVVNEVRKIRGELVKIFDYDIDAIFADLREKQNRHSHRVVNLKDHRKAERLVSTD